MPVRALLASRVDTFEKLEIVVALHRASRAVPIRDLVTLTKIDHDDVRRAVVELRNAALVDLTSRAEVQLLPPTSQDHEAVAALVRLYHEDRMTIVKTLGETAMERIRGMVERKKRGEDDHD